MRSLVFAFACYIFSITLAPCQDAYTCEDPQAHEASHSHEQDDRDTCSPFCICSCCSTPSVLETGFSVIVSVKLDHEETLFNPYRIAHLLPVYHSFWQPPKL